MFANCHGAVQLGQPNLRDQAGTLPSYSWTSLQQGSGSASAAARRGVNGVGSRRRPLQRNEAEAELDARRRAIQGSPTQTPQRAIISSNLLQLGALGTGRKKGITGSAQGKITDPVNPGPSSLQPQQNHSAGITKHQWLLYLHRLTGHNKTNLYTYR